MSDKKNYSQTTTSRSITHTTSYTYSFPPIFTPISSTVTDKIISSENADSSFTIKIFSPLPSSTSLNADTTSTIDNSGIPLPTIYAPLPSSAKGQLTFGVPTMTSSAFYFSPTATNTNIVTTNSNTSKLSGGKIACIVIVSMLGTAILSYMFYVMCWTRRDYDKDEKESEMSSVYHDDNQPINFPRAQPFYDPNRLYSSASSFRDPREDFRAYYYARSAASQFKDSSNSCYSSTASTTLNSQTASLLPACYNNKDSTPFFGGYHLQHEPIMSQQISAHSNNYPPTHTAIPAATAVSPSHPYLYQAPFMMPPSSMMMYNNAAIKNPYFSSNKDNTYYTNSIIMNSNAEESSLTSIHQHNSEFSTFNNQTNPLQSASNIDIKSNYGQSITQSSQSSSPTLLPVIYDDEEKEKE
ncbi:uncharacterized protein BX663DRAFT_577636 [Cokeromyces recurvatus]|uniref:uncharacterized protein n=1 Tax=Cokeromyces recurvatus TaxID=90255 RepID=UPI00221FCD6E|nr:uncharacterized protein BX663DRAFT_577636 [Cokeromyces recurvatus]KAI7906515.1 hypothetical protein BX663DRAFT_577636 [Cokeromyces recurvatus]